MTPARSDADEKPRPPPTPPVAPCVWGPTESWCLEHSAARPSTGGARCLALTCRYGCGPAPGACHPGACACEGACLDPSCHAPPTHALRDGELVRLAEPTCLGDPAVDGCNCGLVVGLARLREHQARVAAATRSTPGSTIRAMAGALAELAPMLTFGPDMAWCRDLAHQLDRFAVQLPIQDGGEDAAREVRHA